MRGRQSDLSGGMVEGGEKHCTPLEWVTPIANRIGGFDLDPCASATSELAEKNIRGSGGLEAEWMSHYNVWLNHPFSDPGPWLEKAVESHAAMVVALSKCDPSADWFHAYATQADYIAFPADRIQFRGYEQGAGFPVMYSIYSSFDDAPEPLLGWFDDVGYYFEP